MEPAPPPITIVDPNAPPGATDVLGSDAGWRASPYQKAVAALTAVIVALIVAGVQEIRHVHHEDALDVAAVDAVAFSVSDSGNDWGDEGISLTNAGAQRVTVTGLRLDGTGYREHRVSTRLGPGEIATLPLSTAKNCRPELFTEHVSTIRVRALTSRGDRVERTVYLPPDLTEALGFSERLKCGYLLPREALQSQLVDLHRSGREIVARVDVVNEGVLPLTLGRLGSYPGISMTADLPLTLDRRAFWTGRSRSRRLTLTMRVTDCTSVQQLLDTQDPFDGGFPGAVEVHASHQYAEDDVTLQLSTWNDETGVPDTPLVDLLHAACPGPGPQD